MEVLLIERHKKLGEIGTIVNVKNGYARNYLIPTNKAIIASEKNKKLFEMRKAEIQKDFDIKKSEAEKIRKNLDNKNIIFIEQAAEDERLYGSVTSSHIANAIKDQLGQIVHKSSVSFATQIKYLGVYTVDINVFSDLHAQLRVIVARTTAEADEVVVKLNDSSKQDISKKPQDDSNTEQKVESSFDSKDNQ